MVGIKGQTREMIDRDMDIVLNNFDIYIKLFFVRLSYLTIR